MKLTVGKFYGVRTIHKHYVGANGVRIPRTETVSKMRLVDFKANGVVVMQVPYTTWAWDTNEGNIQAALTGRIKKWPVTRSRLIFVKRVNVVDLWPEEPASVPARVPVSLPPLVDHAELVLITT